MDRLELLVRGFLADEPHRPPVAGENISRNPVDGDEGQSRYVDAADSPPLEVVCVERLAGAVVGILADPAGAEDLARARLEQRPLQLVAGGRALMSCFHVGLLSWMPRVWTRRAGVSSPDRAILRTPPLARPGSGSAEHFALCRERHRRGAGGDAELRVDVG